MTREEFISQMGYRDDSPLRNEKSLNIQTGPNGIIDMSNTGMPLMANGRYLPPYSGHHQFEPNSIVTEIPLEKHKQDSRVPKRKGKRQNPDGSVSTHLMRTETIDNINWFSFPSLFENEDGTWLDMSDRENWREIAMEADKRGEIIHFGANKEEALRFGEGSWKPQEKHLLMKKQGGSLPLPKAEDGWFDKVKDGVNSVINPFGTLLNYGVDKVKENVANNWNASRGYAGVGNEDVAIPNILERIWNTGFKNESELANKKIDGVDALEQNMFRMYLGQPQNEDDFQFQKSQYVPTKGHEEGDEYWSIPEEYRNSIYGTNNFPQEINLGGWHPNDGDLMDYLKQQYSGVVEGDMVVGDYTRGVGRDDDNNIYLSAYDKFDLNPFNTHQPTGRKSKLENMVSGFDDLSFGIGDPQSVYDRFGYTHVNSENYPDFYSEGDRGDVYRNDVLNNRLARKEMDLNWDHGTNTWKDSEYIPKYATDITPRNKETGRRAHPTSNLVSQKQYGGSLLKFQGDVGGSETKSKATVFLGDDDGSVENMFEADFKRMEADLIKKYGEGNYQVVRSADIQNEMNNILNSGKTPVDFSIDEYNRLNKLRDDRGDLLTNQAYEIYKKNFPNHYLSQYNTLNEMYEDKSGTAEEQMKRMGHYEEYTMRPSYSAAYENDEEYRQLRNNSSDYAQNKNEYDKRQNAFKSLSSEDKLKYYKTYFEDMGEGSDIYMLKHGDNMFLSNAGTLSEGTRSDFKYGNTPDKIDTFAEAMTAWGPATTGTCYMGVCNGTPGAAHITNETGMTTKAQKGNWAGYYDRSGTYGNDQTFDEQFFNPLNKGNQQSGGYYTTYTKDGDRVNAEYTGYNAPESETMPSSIDDWKYNDLVYKDGGSLPKFQDVGETTGEPILDKEGNYIPFTVDPNEYSTTTPSGQRSIEMGEIDEFFRGSLNSPIYKKRLGLQGSIRDIGSGDGNEAYMFHPDHGMVTRATADKIDSEWYNDDQWQSMRVNMPFQSWDSDKKNTKNQTKVDETVTNRLNALNTMTTDYSSEYDNRLYEKVHHVSDAVQAIAKENGIERDADGQFDMSKLVAVLPPELREDFIWAFAPKSDESDKWLGSHSDTAPHLNTKTGFTDADGNIQYKTNDRKVSMQMTPSQIQQIADEAGITYEEAEARTYAHEVGHSLGAIYEPGYMGYGNDYEQMGTGAGRFANQNYSITDNEAELMRQMMRENYGINVRGGDKIDKHVKEDTYARGVTEAKADMDAVRYDMYKSGIYDYRKGDIDQKTLTKYLDKYRGENGEIDMEKVPLDLKRTLERYKERDFIFLNNNIAMENQQEIGGDDLPIVKNAKYGRELPRFQGDVDSSEVKQEIPLTFDQYKISKPNVTTKQYRQYVLNPEFSDHRSNREEHIIKTNDKGWADKQYYRNNKTNAPLLSLLQGYLIDNNQDVKRDSTWGNETYNALNNHILENKLLNGDYEGSDLITNDLLVMQQYIESKGNPNAGSDKGAKGIVQAMPKTWKDAIKRGWIPENSDPSDINASLAFQKKYTNWLMNADHIQDLESDDEKIARMLVGYNWGRGNSKTFFDNINLVGEYYETGKFDKAGKKIMDFRNKIDEEGSAELFIKDKDGNKIKNPDYNPNYGKTIPVPKDEWRDPEDMNSWLTLLDDDKEATRWTIPKEASDYTMLISQPQMYIKKYGKKAYDKRVGIEGFPAYQLKARDYYSYKHGGSVKRTKQLIKKYRDGGELNRAAQEHLEELGVIDKFEEGGEYTVKKGDTLSNIAASNNTNMDQVVDLNNILNPDKIYPGQKITLPNIIGEEKTQGIDIKGYDHHESFNLAFNSARNKMGINGMFNYKGGLFTTNDSDEPFEQPEYVRRNLKKQNEMVNSVYSNNSIIDIEGAQDVWQPWSLKKNMITDINKLSNEEKIVSFENNFIVEPVTHSTEKGENLSTIAMQHDVELSSIIKANIQLADPNIINPGDKINIPTGNSNSYMVLDKDSQKLHLYKRGNDKPIKSYTVVTGANIKDTEGNLLNKLDAQTVTKPIDLDGDERITDADRTSRGNFNIDWEAGNSSTGAGIYTIGHISKDSNTYYDETGKGRNTPSFSLKNERGDDIGMSIHGISKGNESRIPSFSTDTPDDNSLSHGCINGQCSDLIDMYNNPDITEGTKVYVLPQDKGNSFEYKNGQLNFKVSDENRVSYSGYFDERAVNLTEEQRNVVKRINTSPSKAELAKMSDADRNSYNKRLADDMVIYNNLSDLEQKSYRKGQGVNRTINTINYKPIKIDFNRTAMQNDKNETWDFNNDAEYNEITEPFIKALVDHKREIMMAASIDGDDYNDIAELTVGIFGQESGFGEDNSDALNLIKGIRKKFSLITGGTSSNMDPKAEMAFYNEYDVDINNKSVGWTQLRWSAVTDEEKEALKKVNITSPKDFMDPTKSAIGTAVILGVRSRLTKTYYNRVQKARNADRVKNNTEEVDVNMINGLLLTWNPAGEGYNNAVKDKMKYTSLFEVNSRDIEPVMLTNGKETKNMNKNWLVDLKTQIRLYTEYVNGNFHNSEEHKHAKAIYNKLNRVYYNDSKNSNMNVLDYMKALVD